MGRCPGGLPWLNKRASREVYFRPGTYFCSPANLMKELASGKKGLPSYRTTLHPCINGCNPLRYIIHPVVVYCRATEVEFISRCSIPSFNPLKTMPPTECTMHFGVPVVPDYILVRASSPRNPHKWLIQDSYLRNKRPRTDPKT